MGKLGKTMAAIPDGMADRTDPIDGYVPICICVARVGQIKRKVALFGILSQ